MSKDYIIIGSKAIKHHFPDFPRIPMDIDVICSKTIYLDCLKDKHLIESVKENENSAIIKWNDMATPVEYLFSDGIESFEMLLRDSDFEGDYAPIEILYSLKKAHIHFPIKFQKHIEDLMFLREKLREKYKLDFETDLKLYHDILNKSLDLTELHFKETEKRLGKLKTPKMNQNTKMFFGKSEKYIKSYYIHDNIHLAIAHDQDPIYLSILKEGAEVETDVHRWSPLTLQQKIWCVLEEVYVIALERKIIPQLFDIKYLPALINDEKSIRQYGMMSDKEAFDWALMRVCTTLCDGFFREFAVRAYDEIQKQYDKNYVDKFFKNIGKYEKKED